MVRGNFVAGEDAERVTQSFVAALWHLWRIQIIKIGGTKPTSLTLSLKQRYFVSRYSLVQRSGHQIPIPRDKPGGSEFYRCNWHNTFH
jgi:hypothetical protein